MINSLPTSRRTSWLIVCQQISVWLPEAIWPQAINFRINERSLSSLLDLVEAKVHQKDIDVLAAERIAIIVVGMGCPSKNHYSISMLLMPFDISKRLAELSQNTILVTYTWLCPQNSCTAWDVIALGWKILFYLLKFDRFSVFLVCFWPPYVFRRSSKPQNRRRRMHGEPRGID